MSKRYLLGLLLSLIPTLAFGQSTTLSGTVQDAGGQLWFAGSVVASFVPVQGTTSGQYTWSGGAFNPGVSITASINSSGFYTMSLPSTTALVPAGGKWTITANSGTTGLQTASVTISVTGGAQTQNFTPPALSIGAGPGAVAYVDSEVFGQVGQTYYQLNPVASNGVNRVCQVVTGTTCTTWANAGGSSSSTGPVFNVNTYGASPVLVDNATAFAAATGAAEASTLVGTPVLRTAVSNNCPSATSCPTSFIVQAGDTVLVWLSGPNISRTITITDNCATCTGGTNAYLNKTPLFAGTITSIGLWGTAPQGTGAATTITVNDSGTDNIYVTIAAFTNVGAFRYQQVPTFTTASSSTPSLNDPTTIESNNLWVVGFNWYLAATNVSAVANGGVLAANVTSSNTTLGLGVVTQAAPSAYSSVTNGLTLSNASAVLAIGLELRSHSEVKPTIYVPQGEYRYTSGLTLLHPMTLKGEGASSRLCYTGSAHAVDIAPTNLPVAGEWRNWVVDGLEFGCGANMTEGIFINRYAEFIGIRNNTFLDFGNPTSWAIWSVGDNYDIEIGPQNRFFVEDGVPKNLVIGNTGHFDNNTFFRIHDNLAGCWLGGGNGPGCNASNAGIGFEIDGAHNRFYHNNIAYFNPNVWMFCSSALCFGNNIESNMFETVLGAGTGTVLPEIQFTSGNDQLLVINNSSNNHNFAGVGFLGPRSGTDLLTGSRINWNNTVGLPLTTPLVVLNNVVGNTGNQSFGNGCAVVFVNALPCALTHTAGGNIPQWNIDSWGTCTMNGTTGCPAFTFSQVYSVAPKCTASWNGAGALTGILKAAVTTTTLTITSSVAGDTAGINWNCSTGDGQ